MTVIAGILSFAFSGKLYGIRERTIVAALLVGFIARLIGRKMAFFPDKLFPQERPEDGQQSENDRQEHICIMILRKAKKLQILNETKNMLIQKLACKLIQKDYNNIIRKKF